MRILVFIALSTLAVSLKAQGTAGQPGAPIDDSQARPPVSKADIEIVKRARKILSSPSKWNRADKRICPADAKTFSLYCALEKATDEVSGKFEHRGAAMQEARFVIDEIASNRNYDHRLMDYNNDPKTTFADVQKVFVLLEERIATRLKTGNSQAQPAATQTAAVQPAAAPSVAAGGGDPPATPPVTKADLEIVKRAREILDSPAKWNRADTQVCPPDAKTVSLFCALQMAAKEVAGTFDNSGATIQEARLVAVEIGPNGSQYHARLTDFNNDPATTFADIQKLFNLVEQHVAKRLSDKPARGK
jgi:hypothetical protein